MSSIYKRNRSFCIHFTTSAATYLAIWLHEYFHRITKDYSASACTDRRAPACINTSQCYTKGAVVIQFHSVQFSFCRVNTQYHEQHARALHNKVGCRSSSVLVRTHYSVTLSIWGNSSIPDHQYIKWEIESTCRNSTNSLADPTTVL